MIMISNSIKIISIKIDNQYADFKIKDISKDKIIFLFWDKSKTINGECIINIKYENDKEYSYNINLYINEKEILNNNCFSDFILDKYIPNINICLSNSGIIDHIDIESDKPGYKMIIHFKKSEQDEYLKNIFSKNYYLDLNVNELIFELEDLVLIFNIETGYFTLSYNKDLILKGNIKENNKYYIFDKRFKDKDIFKIYLNYDNKEILKIINSYTLSKVHN